MQEKSWRRAAAITPHDTNPSITGHPTAIYVGGAGNIVMRLIGASTTSVTFTGVPAGTVLNVEPSAILATSTTATNMLALYE